MIPRPNLLNIIRTDYLASLAVIGPLVVGGMFLLFYVLGEADAAFFLSLAAAVTMVAVPVLLWRVNMIRSALSNGVDVPGVVTNVSFFRGRGRVTYVYTYQGDKLESSNAVQQNKRTSALAVGSQVTIALDPNNPKRAFIRELYT